MMTTRLNSLKKRIARLNEKLPAPEETEDDWLTDEQRKQMAILQKMRLDRNLRNQGDGNEEGQD